MLSKHPISNQPGKGGITNYNVMEGMYGLVVVLLAIGDVVYFTNIFLNFMLDAKVTTVEGINEEDSFSFKTIHFGEGEQS